ncbi:plasmid partitioning protein RepB C-terminal domain-containing protein [Mesorhizobium shangrilense]|uniref:Plasmid partitioning protein RepB C-terminal domain-containing protein n=1 Tax=Mesorhizobium shangrilense TaxID=460060 RepID=A0ABV2DGA0_9HYPH
MKSLTKDAAHRALENSGDRHARNIAAGQLGSKAKLFAPEFLATYEAECKRMRDFITKAEKSERRLDSIVGALEMMIGDKKFCVLLASEELVTMPISLAHKLSGATGEPHMFSPPGKPPSDAGENREPVSGICPDVLDVLRDSPVHPKIFGLLQKALPARQLEIVRLMVAMDRVRPTYARMLVALTPQAQLAKNFHPRAIANLAERKRGAMVLDLGRLSRAVLGAVEQRGQVGLELVAASRYFDRLMDNSRVVRYLARNFPGHFEEFHNLSVSFLK